MEDKEIVRLLQNRDQKALDEIEQKYHKYLLKISMNILGNKDDADECVNDTYLSVWQSISAKTSYDLKHYLARTVKNKALKLVEKNSAGKRGGGQVDAALDELEDVAAVCDGPEEAYLKKYDKGLIESFLDELPELDRRIFVRRYWFYDKITEIAKRYDISVITVNTRLRSSRNKLKKHLSK